MGSDLDYKAAWERQIQWLVEQQDEADAQRRGEIGTAYYSARSHMNLLVAEYKRAGLAAPLPPSARADEARDWPERPPMLLAKLCQWDWWYRRSTPHGDYWQTVDLAATTSGGFVEVHGTLSDDRALALYDNDLAVTAAPSAASEET
jgi:hypothetical protein